jgi:hypothetical protein
MGSGARTPLHRWFYAQVPMLVLGSMLAQVLLQQSWFPVHSPFVAVQAHTPAVQRLYPQQSLRVLQLAPTVPQQKVAILLPGDWSK